MAQTVRVAAIQSKQRTISYKLSAQAGMSRAVCISTMINLQSLWTIASSFKTS